MPSIVYWITLLIYLWREWCRRLLTICRLSRRHVRSALSSIYILHDTPGVDLIKPTALMLMGIDVE